MVLLLVPIPGLTSSLGIESYVCLGVWLAAGIAFYFTSARKAAEDSTGIRNHLVAELPAEV